MLKYPAVEHTWTLSDIPLGVTHSPKTGTFDRVDGTMLTLSESHATSQIDNLRLWRRSIARPAFPLVRPNISEHH